MVVLACAQVLEETGYDIEPLVNENDFIELNLEGKRNKLYIVAGLDPDSAQFAPKCKGVSVAGGASAVSTHKASTSALANRKCMWLYMYVVRRHRLCGLQIDALPQVTEAAALVHHVARVDQLVGGVWQSLKLAATVGCCCTHLCRRLVGTPGITWLTCQRREMRATRPSYLRME